MTRQKKDGSFFMAYDQRLTLSNEEKVTKLAASNTYSSIYLSDQFIQKLGTNRLSEIKGLIGNNGKPTQELINDYLLSL